MCSQTQNRLYRDKSDEELVTLCEADREAFGELAVRYRQVAFRAACCVLRNELDAEDQVQSALCKAYEHMGAFRRSAKFSTWLVRIVVNECLMQLRHARRVQTLPIDAITGESLRVRLVDGSETPEQVLEQESIAKLMEREIRRVPPLLRKPFLLRDIEQKPMEEVAESLGISIHAAKSRLSRARAELRKRLEPHVRKQSFTRASG